MLQFLGPPSNRTNFYDVHGLNARTSQVYEIPVHLVDPPELPGMYKNYNGSLETSVEYKEFATSIKTKF